MSTEQLDWTGWEQLTGDASTHMVEWVKTVEREGRENMRRLTHDGDGYEVWQCGDMRMEYRMSRTYFPHRYYIRREPEGLVQQYITFTPIEQALPLLLEMVKENRYGKPMLLRTKRGEVFDAHPFHDELDNITWWRDFSSEEYPIDNVIGVALMPLPKE